MANLSNLKKAELIQLCNKKDDDIAKLDDECRKYRKENYELKERVNNIADVNSKLEKEKEDYKNTTVQQSSDIQELRKQVSQKDIIIKQTSDNYQQLRKDFDGMVYKNGINSSNAAKYKLASIVLGVMFILTLIYTCIS